MSDGFHCHTCGEHHDELPMEFGAEAPTLYFNIPEDERVSRCDLTSDLCVQEIAEALLHEGSTGI